MIEDASEQLLPHLVKYHHSYRFLEITRVKKTGLMSFADAEMSLKKRQVHQDIFDHNWMRWREVAVHNTFSYYCIFRNGILRYRRN